MDTIDKINHLLIDSGMTGAELCRRCGLSSGTYSMWNTRKRQVSSYNRFKVARVLGVTPESLLPDDEVSQKERELQKERDNEDLLETFAMIRTNPAMQFLFQKVKDLTPNQLFALAQMVEAFHD